MFRYPVPHGRHTHGTHGYAVVDLETTGFDAKRADRIVEIAIVRIDATGRELGRFETLVDPGRSTGPSSVHHITEAMVRGAPTFAQIAPVGAGLAGRGWSWSPTTHRSRTPS